MSAAAGMSRNCKLHDTIRRNISRPNGNKAIKRLENDIRILIERAPDSHVASWPMDAEAASAKLFAILRRMYSLEKDES